MTGSVMGEPVRLVDVTTADGVRLHGAFLAAQPVVPAAAFDAVMMMHGVANAFYNSLGPAFSDTFAAHGYAVLGANNRGHDVISRGSAAQPYLGAAFERLEDALQDWRAWLDWLVSRGFHRVLLCGHSLGAVKTAYVLANGGHPSVRAAVLFSPPRFSYASWMASTRAEEFRRHLAQAQGLVDAGTPDALFAVTMPVPFISAAAAYLAKYGPEARFDVFANVTRIGVPVLGFTGDREFTNVDFREHPAEYESAARGKPDLEHLIVADGDHYYRGCETWVMERLLAWMARVAPVAS